MYTLYTKACMGRIPCTYIVAWLMWALWFCKVPCAHSAVSEFPNIGGGGGITGFVNPVFSPKKFTYLQRLKFKE